MVGQPSRGLLRAKHRLALAHRPETWQAALERRSHPHQLSPSCPRSAYGCTPRPTILAGWQHGAVAFRPPVPAHSIEGRARWPKEVHVRQERRASLSSRPAAQPRRETELQIARIARSAFRPAWACSRALVCRSRSCDSTCPSACVTARGSLASDGGRNSPKRTETCACECSKNSR